MDGINSKAELERFIKGVVEQLPMNFIQGLPANLTELKRLAEEGGGGEGPPGKEGPPGGPGPPGAPGEPGPEGPGLEVLLAAGIGVILHGENGLEVRGADFAHYIWVGTAEPINAVEYDQWIKPE